MSKEYRVDDDTVLFHVVDENEKTIATFKPEHLWAANHLADILNTETATLQAALEESQRALAIANHRARVATATAARFEKSINEAIEALSNQTHGNAQYQPDVLHADSILRNSLSLIDYDTEATAQEIERAEQVVSETVDKFKVGDKVVSSAGGIGTIKAFLEDGYVDCTTFHALEIDLTLEGHCQWCNNGYIAGRLCDVCDGTGEATSQEPDTRFTTVETVVQYDEESGDYTAFLYMWSNIEGQLITLDPFGLTAKSYEEALEKAHRKMTATAERVSREYFD